MPKQAEAALEALAATGDALEDAWNEVCGLTSRLADAAQRYNTLVALQAARRTATLAALQPDDDRRLLVEQVTATPVSAALEALASPAAPVLWTLELE